MDHAERQNLQPGPIPVSGMTRVGSLHSTGRRTLTPHSAVALIEFARAGWDASLLSVYGQAACRDSVWCWDLH